MELSLDRPGGYLIIRSVGPHGITVMDRELVHSFILSPSSAVENWPVTDAGQLGLAHVEDVLALKPEVVLLGTGERQVFPSAEVMAGFLRRGVGIEVMTNASAARTYSLLAAEGRLVVAAFILPG
jgi:uncharacterized protein